MSMTKEKLGALVEAHPGGVIRGALSLLLLDCETGRQDDFNTESEAYLPG